MEEKKALPAATAAGFSGLDTPPPLLTAPEADLVCPRIDWPFRDPEGSRDLESDSVATLDTFSGACCLDAIIWTYMERLPHLVHPDGSNEGKYT